MQTGRVLGPGEGSEHGVRNVRKMLDEHGRLGAIQRLGEDRGLIEIASAYGMDENVGVPNFVYSGWCMTALPHSRLASDQTWRHENSDVTLLVEPGRRALPGKPEEWIGVPYGALARLILIFLQTQALRSGSRQIELGRSMNSWFERLEMKPGGKSYKLVREQALRIAMCRLSFQSERDGAFGITKADIVEDGLLFMSSSTESAQGSLFTEGVTLSEKFFRGLKKHAVPIEERAIRHIRTSSMAIDVYAWLSYRLHALKRPQPVSWGALHSQFGKGYGTDVAAFRRDFRKALQKALVVYPEAAENGIEETQSGLLLKQVRPPIMAKIG